MTITELAKIMWQVGREGNPKAWHPPWEKAKPSSRAHFKAAAKLLLERLDIQPKEVVK